MSRTVLITGATGRLARTIAEQLAAEGWTIKRAARFAEGPQYVTIGEIGPETDWTAALAGVDAVVHCAALTWLPESSVQDQEAAFQNSNCAGTANLARQAASSGAKRFVLISSATVNGRASGVRPFRGDDPPAPDSAYSRSKRDAENALFEIGRTTSLEPVVIRPPRIIWPELSGNLAMLARLVERGVPLPFGSVMRNARDNVSPASLTRLVSLALSNPNAVGQVFLVSDGTPFSTRELLVRLGHHVGRPPRLIKVPEWTLRFVVRAMPASLLGRMKRADMETELFGNLKLDISPARELLGWEPADSTI